MYKDQIEQLSKATGEIYYNGTDKYFILTALGIFLYDKVMHVIMPTTITKQQYDNSGIFHDKVGMFIGSNYHGEYNIEKYIGKGFRYLPRSQKHYE
jgi:hypothetical protein